jgi:predicted kinase
MKCLPLEVKQPIINQVNHIHLFSFRLIRSFLSMIILVHKIFLLTQSVVKWLWRKTEQDDDIDDRSLFLSKKNDEYLPEVCDQSDATTNFPFLCDKRTIYHIQKGKIMFIMRGVSGSGKSTLVNLICKIYKDVSVCSADQYFMKQGEYQFDHRNLTTAHENCSKKATKACLNGVPVIVIDNTNVKRWEMGNYLSLALSNNYAVVIVRPKTSWCNNPEKLAEFNEHGVTADIIRAKLRTFEEITPLYFGWFISEEQSNTLYNLARKSLDECIKLFPQLKDLLLFQSPGIYKLYDFCNLILVVKSQYI